MTPVRIHIRRRRKTPYAAHAINGAESVRQREAFRKLRTLFTLEELEGLALELLIAWDDLGGETLVGKSAALVRACRRRGKLGELEKLIERDRPALAGGEKVQ